jgi:hypothetical protein
MLLSMRSYNKNLSHTLKVLLVLLVKFLSNCSNDVETEDML